MDRRGFFHKLTGGVAAAFVAKELPTPQQTNWNALGDTYACPPGRLTNVRVNGKPVTITAGTTMHVGWTWDPPTLDRTLENSGFAMEAADHEFPTVTVTLTEPNGPPRVVRAACRRKRDY